MLRSRFVLLACMLIPAGTLAAPSDQVRELHQQVAALQLDHALNLTQQQAQALLPLLQEAQAKLQGLKAQRAASQPALVAALTQAVADLEASGTISETTLQALKAAHGGSPGTLRQDMTSLWQQAKLILTAQQLQALKSVRVGLRPAASAALASSTSRDRGRLEAGHFRVMHTLLSDSFVALVQARAG